MHAKDAVRFVWHEVSAMRRLDKPLHRGKAEALRKTLHNVVGAPNPVNDVVNCLANLGAVNAATSRKKQFFHQVRQIVKGLLYQVNTIKRVCYYFCV